MPGPTAYEPKSDFDKSNPHGRAFSFGISREAYSKVYCKESPPSDLSLPGPGTYSIKPKLGNESLKFSIYGRNGNHCKLVSILNNLENVSYNNYFREHDFYKIKSRTWNV